MKAATMEFREFIEMNNKKRRQLKSTLSKELISDTEQWTCKIYVQNEEIWQKFKKKIIVKKARASEICSQLFILNNRKRIFKKIIFSREDWTNYRGPALAFLRPYRVERQDS
jgi:hypothetical protein